MAYTYAGQYGPELMTGLGSSAATKTLISQSVNVYTVGTTTPVTLYTDRTKGTPQSQPVSADVNGNLTFFADPGRYDIVFTPSGGSQQRYTVWVPVDSAEPNIGALGSATYVAQGGQVVSVKDAAYGAKGDGTTDDLTAINAAVAALGTNGGQVFFPPGNYKVSGTIAANRDNVHFVGVGIGATKITTSSATLPVFDFGDNVTLRTFLTVQNMMIATSVTRTAAGFIRARNVADLKVDRCRLDGGYIGIDLFNTQMTRLLDLHIINCAPGSGAAIQADGNGTNLFIVRVCTDAPVGSQPSRGLSLKQWDGVFLTDTQFNHAGTALCIEPAAGNTFQHLYASNCSFDTNSNVGLLTLPGVGTTRRIWFDNCWFGSNSGNGITLDGGADDVQLIAPKIVANGQHGIQLVNCANVQIVAPTISGNSAAVANTYDGVSASAGVSNWQVIGGNIRPVAGYGSTQNRAVTIGAGAGDYITVRDVNMNGNNDAANEIANSATGSHNLFAGNKGFNPRGHTVTQPSVPASTVAATNTTGCDCTVFINGGTVSAVAVGGTATGITATNRSVRVPAGQTITLTYSVAPTWQWFGD